MHMWVICVGRHLSRALKNVHAPAGDGTGDRLIYKRTLHHVAIKAGLYHKTIQVCDVPNLYPVTLYSWCVSRFSFHLYMHLLSRAQLTQESLEIFPDV